ncbi:MAG: hypothetical protein HY735_35700 [Verrucomicrobia bacterium]|nr:hypothetical protein [Verrucomicrobiota bacterium]
MRIIIVASDQTRQNFLGEVVKVCAPRGAIDVRKAYTANDAASTVQDRDTVPFIVLSLVRSRTPDLDMPILKRDFPKVRIIVELEDDDVESAFKMLELGAFNVVSSVITKTSRLWQVFRRAIAKEPPYDPIVTVDDRNRPWGFISLPADSESFAHNDYYFAIRPTMNRLGLDLRRMDEIPIESVLLPAEKIKQAIADRPVFVTLISYPTPNVQRELEIASTLRKKIIFLRRADPGPLPSLPQIPGSVDYSTMTELAMKLFFGLGGQLSQVRPNIMRSLGQKRRRHGELIDKKFSGGLSLSENEELEKLEKALDQAEAPLYEPIMRALIDRRERLKSSQNEQRRT